VASTMKFRGRILGISISLALVVSAAFAGAARAAEDSDVVLPSISSDKADYAPGETVTLHGSHWAPGETVHIRVNDDSGQTWSRDVDVVADADGNISDQFALPDWFVALYSVSASGPVSGSATTSFSDATLVFALATAGTDAPSNVTWSVDWDLWQGQGNDPNLTCDGARTSFGTAAYSGNTLTSGSGTQPGINQNASARPTAVRTTGTLAGTYVFDYWSTSATSTTPLTNLCRAGVNGPTVFTLFAHFKLADVTPPATTASATLAGGGAYSSGAWTNRDVTVALSAADNAGGSGVKEIRYSINGGAETVVAGSSATVPVSTEGASTISYFAKDNAGNAETAKTFAVQIDKTAPTIARNVPADDCSVPGSNGWCRGIQTAGFTAADSGSGLADPSQASFTQSSSAEGSAVLIASGAATDVAGNSNAGINAGPFMIDATDPVVTVTLERDPDHGGWYNAPVGYSADATDAISGKESCDAAGSYAGPDGDPVSVSLNCSDEAGNRADDSETFKYDATPSSSQASAPEFNNGPTITVAYASADAAGDLSGLDSVELWVNVPGGAGFQAAVNAAKTTASGSFDYKVNAGEGSYRFYTVVVDRAGNREAAPADPESSTRVTTTLQDETAPVTSDDAPGGWENSAVTVHLSATDGGSGVGETYYRVDGTDVYVVGTSVLVPAPVDHSNDGVHTIDYYSVDRATNVEGVKTATVRIDTTAPALTDLGATPAAPDGNNGWYVHPVSNRFRATDAGSGLDSACLAAFPADTGGENVQSKTTSGEGTAVKVASDGCTDLAGNTAAAVESAGFAIDMTAPSISLASRLPAPNANGWNNTGVTVTWDCADSLSGPTTAQVSDTKSDEGAGQTAHGTCEDGAGNTAAAQEGSISIDRTSPVVAGSRAPGANSYGWNKVDVVVSFTCADVGSTQSGIDVDTVAGATVSSEGADQSVTNTGDCVDEAGNAAAPGTIGGISIDKSDPTITLASRLPAANANGWNNTDVDVEWSCADQGGLSGVVAAEAADTVSGEGADQSAHGTCEDRAGNSATASKNGISIDKSKPSISIVAPANGQSYKWNVAVAAAYSCSDGLSGLAGCSGDVANGVNFVVLPVGSKSFNVDSSDRAGNTAAAASSYSVIYDFLGLFQPIDMGANVLNAVKAGSGVPVKFKLGGNVGLDVFQTGSPSSVGISCSATAVIDQLEETVTASTSGLQYDAAADQYVYVWKTNSAWAGTCRQLKVFFKDGRAVTANFKFK
jgi:hypothetical protein